MDIERRYTPIKVETRAGGEESRTIGGLAAVFNSESKNLGGMVEIIADTAFDHSRAEGWPSVLARYNHDDNRLLGTSDAGTLRLSVASEGLLYEVDVPQSREDVYELVKRGDVFQSSFAFRIMPDGDEWSYDEDRDLALRTVHSLILHDVAPVNNPAYADATVGLRSLAQAKSADIAEVEKLAKDNELKRLFKRSDESPNTLFGPLALALVKGKFQA